MGRHGAGLWRYDTIELHVSIAIMEGTSCLGSLHLFSGRVYRASANPGGKLSNLYRTPPSFPGFSSPQTIAERKTAAFTPMAAVPAVDGRPCSHARARFR